ncbi:MAG: ribonuclease H, partial [Leptolyngbyaceae cyanobacterium bins.59]|nr:ribonuclease H [Leptolyngbyaceae cyanobacterium bins.59]
GNPGPGGYGVIIETSPGQYQTLGGHDPATTNNRMELTAILVALQQVPGAVRIVSDSSYCIDALTKWASGWQRRGWVTTEGKPVENQDLIKAILALLKGRLVEFTKVKGHSKGATDDQKLNILADAEAVRQRDLAADGSPKQVAIASTAKPKAGGKIYLVLTLRDQVLHVFYDWNETSTFMRGKANKQRAAKNPAEARAIAQEWGVEDQLNALLG